MTAVAPKVDLKKALDAYRAKVGEFRVLEVPPLRYLALDGHGDPNTAAYADAITTIYPVAYKLKFASKRELGRDYVVPPLEALWSADDMATFTTARDKSRWDWTLLNLVPDWVPREMFEVVAEGSGVRLLDLAEGRCVQTLHVGPFDEEGPTLARLHSEVIPGHGFTMTGRHHEIYFGDPRTAAPEKLRTILRQPVAPIAG